VKHEVRFYIQKQPLMQNSSVEQNHDWKRDRFDRLLQSICGEES
jgi:hypothetical protein